MNVQTVQSTGKAWKAIQAVGVVGMIGGLVAFWETGAPACGFFAGAAVPIWLIGRAGAWWFHS